MKKNRKKMNEARDNILDKTIKVYDLNAFIDKEVNDGSRGEEYETFHFGDGAAIIVTPNGDGCIVDYEAIGSSFNATSDTVYVDLCPKPGDDGNGHRTFSIAPTARLKVTVDELLSAPSRDMKVKDFFYKHDYNDRCRRNFDDIVHYIANSSVVESKKKSRKHLIIEDVDAAMKDINANMEQPTTIEKHVDLPPAYASAVEDHEKTREHIGKVMKQLRDDANKVIAKNPGTGKKISRKPYTEKYTLEEGLFEDFDNESLKEALDDVEWKGATADIIAQIKKYNPNATYKIISRKSDDYTINRIYISFNDKPNRSFLNDLIKKYNLKKTPIDTICSRTKEESPYILITPYLGAFDFSDEPSVYDYYVYVREFNGNNKRDESLVTEKRNNCRGEECANDKEARANRFAQKAAHKEKNDKRDELEESAFNNKIRYYTKSMIPLSLSNLFFMGTGRGPVDMYDAVEDSNSVDELTAKLRDIVDDEIALDRKTDDYVRYTVTDPFGNVSYLKIAIADNLEEYAELQEDERLDEAIPSLDSNKFWGGSTVKAEDRKNREKQVDEFAKHLASKIFSDKFIRKLDEKGYDTDEKKYEFYVKFLDTSPIKKENGETRHNDRLEKFILKDPEFNDKAHDMSGSIHNDLLAYTGGTNGTSFIPLRFIEPYVKYATDMMKSKFKDVINKKEQAQRDKDEDDALNSAFDESVKNKSKKKLSESNELTVDEANAKLKERFGKGFKIKIEPYIEDDGEEWYCFWGSNDCYGYETVDEAYKAVCEYMFYKDLDLDESVNNEIDESFWDDGSAFRDEEEKQRWLNQAMGRREMASGSRNRQLVNNVEELLYEYDNGISDGYNELFKNDEELIDWTYDQIFDLKASGHGMTRYRKGICDDLKYLGRDFIFSEIKRIGHEIGVVEENGITESKQPDIFECPICHRNFTLGECEHDDLTCQCPRCHSELIKTDNGEYTEIEESANLNEMTSDEIFSARQGIFDKVANRKNQKFKRREDKEEKRLRCLDAINDIIRAEKIDLNNIDGEAERILNKEDKYEINTLKEYIDLYGRDKVLEMIKDQLKDENNIKSSKSESLEEDFNLTMSLYEFEPWTVGSTEIWNKIMMTDGALDKLERELELEYPEGMSEKGFNDLLRYESDWVLKAAGITDTKEESEKYEEYFIASIDNTFDSDSIGASCSELEKEPYDFYQGSIIFEDDYNLGKIKELNLQEGDKVKIGVYKMNEIGDYGVDIISKLDSD